jgi:transcriptional regulator with XRE-family HTH domain
MEKVDLTKQFAHRLRDAMVDAGFNSQRSTSGVCIHKLAEMTGYSVQICRKYLRGEAIPEPTKIVDIAAKLNVSAGWLLFGESHNNLSFKENNISLSRELLHYTLSRSEGLYNNPHFREDAADFLLDLLSNISQINTSEAQLKKIIDLALSTITYFRY